MTKYEFLAAVRSELGFLPKSDIDAAERYFESYFAGNQSEEEVAARLGNPRDAAKNYYANNLVPRGGAAPESAAQPVKKRNNVWIIVVILVILSPILIPAAIFAGSLIMAFVAVIIGIYLMMLFGGITIWLSGAAVVLKGLFSGLGFANVILECGIGFLMFGIGLALTLLAVYIAVKLIPWFIKKIVNFGSKRIRRQNT